MALVTKKQFSEQTKTAPSTVTAALKKGLSEALVGRKIDTTHPEAVRYAKKAATRARQYDAGRKKTGKKRTEESSPTVEESLIDVRELGNMTLNEIVERYGTDAAVSEWLKAAQLVEKVTEIRLKNAATEGKLVSRQLVEDGILGPIDGAFTRMLTDGVRTITQKVFNQVKAGGSLSDCEKIVGKDLSAYITTSKKAMEKALK